MSALTHKGRKLVRMGFDGLIAALHRDRPLRGDLDAKGQPRWIEHEQRELMLGGSFRHVDGWDRPRQLESVPADDVGFRVALSAVLA